MNGWRTYDQVANAYNSLAVPQVFTAPARDLVAVADVPAGAKVLDVGSGSGIVAQFAAGAAGSAGMVVALDPSVEMMRLARARAVRFLVAGRAPGLPFPDAVFDIVLANFVVSHFPDHRTAVQDAVRVLRPGGRLGVTAWAVREDPLNQLWQQTAESLAGKEPLRRALEEVLPGEERFSEPSRLRQALQEAGLAGIDIQTREYSITTTISEFLAIKDVSVQARFLREALSAAGWARFREQVAHALSSRFRDPIEQRRQALIGLGTKVSK